MFDLVNTDLHNHKSKAARTVLCNGSCRTFHSVSDFSLACDLTSATEPDNKQE